MEEHRVKPVIIIFLAVCAIAGAVFMFYGSIAAFVRGEGEWDDLISITGAAVFIMVGISAVLIEGKAGKRRMELMSHRHTKTKEILDSVAGQGHRITECAGELAASLAGVNAGIGRILEILSVMEETEKNNACTVNEQTSHISGIRRNIAKAGGKAGTMEETVKETLRLVDMGSDNVRKMKNVAERVSDSGIRIKTTLSGHSDYAGRIKELAGRLGKNISRINLNAMNISVESARSGHGGRGFMVTADKIRELSDEAAGSIAQIEEYIAQLEYQSEMSEKYLNGMHGHIEDEKQLLNETADNYERLSEGFNDLFESLSMTEKELLHMEKSGEVLLENISTYMTSAVNMNSDIRKLSETGETLLKETEAMTSSVRELEEKTKEIEKQL